MKRRMVLGLVLGIGALMGGQSSVGSEPVWLTAKGKTYHTHRDCMTLGRAGAVLRTTAAEAQGHGKTLCGICKRRHGAVVKADNRAWASPEVAR